MCRAITCKKCGKTTWAGCGQHVDQVMARVPRRRPLPRPPPRVRRRGLLGRLFGRKS